MGDNVIESSDRGLVLETVHDHNKPVPSWVAEKCVPPGVLNVLDFFYRFCFLLGYKCYHFFPVFLPFFLSIFNFCCFRPASTTNGGRDVSKAGNGTRLRTKGDNWTIMGLLPLFTALCSSICKPSSSNAIIFKGTRFHSLIFKNSHRTFQLLHLSFPRDLKRTSITRLTLICR